MRDFGSPAYRRWRARVYARDGHRCRLCGSTDGLNAHHIRMWARYPALRFVVSNGITLCRVHHLMVCGRETEFEEPFARLLGQGRSARVASLLIRYEESVE
jgi:hypothetical protein